MMLFILSFLAALTNAESIPPPNSASSSSRLWSTSPGTNWNNGYLIGNGRVGATIQGHASSENIVMNENSFWSGNLQNRVNPDALNQMPTLQKLLRDGELEKAEALAKKSYVAIPNGSRHYSPLGNMTLSMNHTSTVTNYERYLDIDTATAGVYYMNGGNTYFREYLTSYPADVVAIRIASSAPGTVTFRIGLGAGASLSADSLSISNNNMIVITGESAPQNAITFAAGARVDCSGGKLSTSENKLGCDNADEAIIFYTAWTSYRKSDPKATVISDLSAIKQSYSEIRAAHLKDYQVLAHRVSLSFGNSRTQQRAMTTAQRVKALTLTNIDPELLALYFDFGRYLLISSSRIGPQALPANLQGIWNHNENPMWGSRFTANINVQMNYWGALVTDLAETQPPLHNLIASVQTQGAKVAKEMYGVGGWVCHHNTDLWGDAAPQDNWNASTWWPSGGPWLTFHLMEYYRYNLDENFLRQWYPTLKSAAQFFVEFLTDYEGYKVTNPTLSPEHPYYIPGTNNTKYTSITLGATMDTQLLRELFEEIAEANEILKLGDDAFVAQLRSIESKLPPYRRNYYGGIMEWIEDYEEQNPGIDHLSPLWAAFPSPEITSANETEFSWVKKTLEHRLAHNATFGIGGWGNVWCIALAGRFFQPDIIPRCYDHLVSDDVSVADSLMNNGAPSEFQIDGNLGAPGAIAEILLQSHETISTRNSSTLTPAGTGTTAKVPLIRLLPALPAIYASAGKGGHVHGLRARGGFSVNIDWDSSGKLTSASITSNLGGTVYVTLGTAVVGRPNNGNNTSSIMSGDAKGVFIKLNTEKGKKYTIATV